jgi:hypothetical protein
MLATHYDSRITETVSIGTSNQISVDGAGSSGGQTTEAINTFLLGEANVVDVTNASIIGTTVVTGVGNQVTADASSDDCFIGILGTSNTVAASASHTANYDTIVGSFNEVDASTTTTGPAVVLGDHETLQNCINCFMFGQNGTLTTSNTMWIGLNAVPGLVITSASSHDNVKRSPLVFASLPACAAGTEGSFAAITDSSTNVWGATITGSSTNHVLGYCDGTNWTVAGK